MNTDPVESLVQGNFGGAAAKSAATLTPAKVADTAEQAPVAKPSSETIVTKSAEQIKEAVDKMNEALKDYGFTQQVQFRIEPDSNRVVVQVVESETQQVIRQIPSEEALRMSQAIGQKLGQLISMQA